MLFKKEKETKNTIRFTEVLESELDTPVIGTLYISKPALKNLGWNSDKLIKAELSVQEG